MSNNKRNDTLVTVGFNQVGGPRYEGNRVTYQLALKKTRIKCPKCGSTHVHKRGFVVRKIRGKPVGNKKATFYEVTIPRVHCEECGIIRQVDISWFSLPHKTYNKAFSKEVLDKAKSNSISKVSQTLGIDWHTANTILKS
ncbi:MAG: transposase family protein [Clostridiales Family XIII bacterium]|jgi:transposase|nr:transposase family protein [Clostridiales Family XIII bacterium]